MSHDKVQKVLFGKTERLYIEYKDSNGDLTNPSSPLVTIYDPDGVFLDSGVPTQESTGIYYYPVLLSTASTTKEGLYQAFWEGTIGSSFITMDEPQHFQGIKVPWQITQPDSIIQSIRRIIGDTNPNNYRISNDELYYFLKDAVDDVQAEYPFGYEITITNTSVSWNKTLYATPFALFKLKTLILVTEATLADFLFDSGNVTLGDIKIDVSSMMRIRLENLKRLQEKYDKLMYGVKMNLGGGHVIDTYVTGLINNTADQDYIVYTME